MSLPFCSPHWSPLVCSVSPWVCSFFAIFISLWASRVAQMVKNQSAMWEIWVQSLDWEDSLEEGKATHSSIVAWRIPTDRGDWRAAVHGVTKRQTWPSDSAYTIRSQRHQAIGSNWSGVSILVGSTQLTFPTWWGLSICKTAQRTWLTISSLVLEKELKVPDFV